VHAGDYHSGLAIGSCSWLMEIFLPGARGQSGVKVLIGDNLAPHFTMPVIQAATENDIRFVNLVPNSTHLLQPLLEYVI